MKLLKRIESIEQEIHGLKSKIAELTKEKTELEKEYKTLVSNGIVTLRNEVTRCDRNALWNRVNGLYVCTDKNTRKELFLFEESGDAMKFVCKTSSFPHVKNNQELFNGGEESVRKCINLIRLAYKKGPDEKREKKPQGKSSNPPVAEQYEKLKVFSSVYCGRTIDKNRLMKVKVLPPMKRVGRDVVYGTPVTLYYERPTNIYYAERKDMICLSESKLLCMYSYINGSRFEISDIHSTSNSEREEEELKAQSILMIYGYSVSKKAGLSLNQRRGCLSYVVKNDVLTKRRVLSYIDFFIMRNGKRKNFEDAVIKWQQDREWVAVNL